MVRVGIHTDPHRLCQNVIFSSQAKAATTRNSRRADSGVADAGSRFLFGNLRRYQRWRFASRVHIPDLMFSTILSACCAFCRSRLSSPRACPQVSTGLKLNESLLSARQLRRDFRFGLLQADVEPPFVRLICTHANVQLHLGNDRPVF